VLNDLFDGRRQLILYHAFFEPGVDEWHGTGLSSIARRRLSRSRPTSTPTPGDLRRKRSEEEPYWGRRRDAPRCFGFRPGIATFTTTACR
jgi:hypothetical protein